MSAMDDAVEFINRQAEREWNGQRICGTCGMDLGWCDGNPGCRGQVARALVAALAALTESRR